MNSNVFKIIEKVMQYLIGIVIVVGFFSLLHDLIRNPVPVSNADVLNITIGALVGAFVTIVGFYYGSSKGSSDKNDALMGAENKKTA